MKIEAILDRPADNICLDHLARVLVDVHQVRTSFLTFVTAFRFAYSRAGQQPDHQRRAVGLPAQPA